jgi:hypothetical protein
MHASIVVTRVLALAGPLLLLPMVGQYEHKLDFTPSVALIGNRSATPAAAQEQSKQ